MNTHGVLHVSVALFSAGFRFVGICTLFYTVFTCWVAACKNTVAPGVNLGNDYLL